MNLDLGVILSLSTGRLFVNPVELHSATDHIYSVYHNQFLDVEQSQQLISQYILYLYPQLEGVGMNEEFHTREDINNFINMQKQIYGNALPVPPMTEIISFELTSQSSGRKR